MSQASLDKTTPKFKEDAQQNQNKPPELDSAKRQNAPSKNIFDTADEKPRVTNIFADAPTQTQRVNIFANDEKSRKTGNIFDKNEGNKSINLFACSKVPQTSTNIFNSSKKPLVRTQKDDDQENFQDKSSSEASSGRIQKQQKQFKTIPEKLIMKFKYENPFEVIKKFDIKKFKNGQNPSKENVVLTFEKPKGQIEGKINVIVRAKQTKVLLFQGQCLKQLTAKVESFMNREDNVKFWVVKHVTETQKEAGKWVKEELKLQLSSIQDANDLKEFISREFSQNETQKEI